MTILEQIAALEAERQHILALGDDWSFADQRRINRIREIETELRDLWHQERQIRADRKGSHGRRLPNIHDI